MEAWLLQQISSTPRDSRSPGIRSTAGGIKLGEVKTAPLHIDRQALIDRLTVVAQEAADKRQAATDAAKATRQGLLDLVAKLTPDQVANLVDHLLGPCDPVKYFTDIVENEKFVSIDQAPTGVETAIEKQVRVLTMATDATVEIAPTDSLYAYL